MNLLDRCADWPAATTVAAVVRRGSGELVESHGDLDRVMRLASLSKPLTAWAVLVAVEEGIVDLDGVLPESATGQPSCTMRHLLSHAGGYPFDGTTPISPPERTRTYSNGGIELAAGCVEAVADMPFAEYLRLAVFEPLGMSATELRGSPARGVFGTVGDMMRFLAEVERPTLLHDDTAGEATRVQYPSLSGIVPGVGRYAQCPWGLGFEIRGGKTPHWTGTRNSPRTFGHFGGSGTMMWTDPDAELSLLAFSDLAFDEWADVALSEWPALSDDALVAYGGSGGPRP